MRSCRFGTAIARRSGLSVSEGQSFAGRWPNPLRCPTLSRGWGTRRHRTASAARAGGHRPGGRGHVPVPVRFTRGCSTRPTPCCATRRGRDARGCWSWSTRASWRRSRAVDEVARYCAAHTDRLELAGPPLVVPGGEAIKNDSGPSTRSARRSTSTASTATPTWSRSAAARCSTRSATPRRPPTAACGWSACRRPSWPRTTRAWASRTASTPSARRTSSARSRRRRRAQRLRLPAHAGRPRLARRHLRGDQGRAAQGRGVLRLDRAPRRAPRRAVAAAMA